MTRSNRQGRARVRWLGAFVALAGFALATAASASPPTAGAQAGVRANLSSGVVKLGDEVAVYLSVDDARSTRVVGVPEVEGLTFGRPSGPRTESGRSWVNGRRSSWRRDTWSVSIRPSEAGDYEIPPFELEVDGASVRTRPLDLRVVRDLRGEDLGFLEITPSAERVVEGQPFSLELRFGWDSTAEVNTADLALPWWGELAGVVELADPELPPGANKVEGVSVNSKHRIVVEQLPQTTRLGRTFRTFRFVKTFLPGRPGTLELPTSFLEFGYVAPSRSLFSRGNERRSSYFVQADEVRIQVVELPSEGQPYDFSGAVGDLAVRASVDTRDVTVGDSIKLTLDWTGEGNLEFFHPPEIGLLDGFRDFRVYGRTEEKSFERRRVVYDLAPLSAEIEAIPPVPLSVFDPEQEGYLTVESEPIPIRVRMLEGASGLEGGRDERFGRDLRDIDTRALGSVGSSSAPPDGALVAGLFALPLGWLVLRSAVRRRGDPDAPLERRRRRATKTLARALRDARSPREELAAFAAFLAARSREPDEAWTGRSRAEWRRRFGAGEGSNSTPGIGLGEGEEAIELLERLERASWGGEARVAHDEILDLARRLARGGER